MSTPALPTVAGIPQIVSGVPKGRHERLYAQNVRLVSKVLGHFPFLTGERREEAYGAGLLGLWHAAKRFNPSLGFAFSTYATRCIRGHVLRYLATERRQQRVPAVSLETPIGDTERISELAEMIADEQAEKPGARLVSEASFDALLEGLKPRQQDVLWAVYQEERPLLSVAEEWGISPQAVFCMQRSALRKLRAQGKSAAR